MLKRRTLPSLLSLVFLLSLLGGCSPSPRQQTITPVPAARVDAGLAHKAADTALTVPGVRDTAAVAVNRDILIGVKVTGFDRLRLRSIRREVKARVEHLNQGSNILVTTDRKLLVELRDLDARIRGGMAAPAQAWQDVEKIKEKLRT